MNHLNIKVRITSSFGVERIYPVCAMAMLLAKLIDQNTFTRANIAILKDLGYVIEVVTEQPRIL